MIGAETTYSELHVERWEKITPGVGGQGGGPDPLWQCGRCGAAVSDCEKHTSWHAASRIGFG